MPATVARSACWLSLDLSWLGSSSSIDMKLLLSVQSKSFPSMANKARGTKVSSCCQLASFKFNYGREGATIVIRAHCEGHPSFPQSCQRACASLVSEQFSRFSVQLSSLLPRD